jgi:hypothetical protein
MDDMESSRWGRYGGQKHIAGAKESAPRSQSDVLELMRQE